MRTNPPSGKDPLQRMLHVVSHELRSPLNTIQSWSHVLENELARALAMESGRDAGPDPGPAAQRAIAGIRTGVRQQVRLIDELLLASRAISGTLELDLRPIAVLPAVEAAVAGAQGSAASRQIEIRTGYSAPDAKVDGDSQCLHLALTHLLSNAIKFSEPGGRIGVELGRQRPFVVIEVADAGRGIDAAFMPRLFQWFHRSDLDGQGLGLGLALVRAVSELHGGTAEARSDGPGRGATFTIRLPEQRPG